MRILFNLLFILILLFLAGPAPVISPDSPCEVRVIRDTHAEYDIDTAEVEQLLEDNSFPCPYVLDMTIWDQAELDRALLKGKRVSVGFYTNDQRHINGERSERPLHHIISFFLIDLYLEEMVGHDFSIANTLSGAEWGTWIVLHELGHMIRSEENLDYSGMVELWCDHFANKNYKRYSIIKEELGF